MKKDYKKPEMQVYDDEMKALSRIPVTKILTDNMQFPYSFVEGTDGVAKTVCAISAVAFDEALCNYEEKHNRAAFIKNIISDNILPGDVYVRAKELHFVTDEPRSVFLIRQMENADVAAGELVSRLFPDRQHDFVLNINENDIVVVKSIQADRLRGMTITSQVFNPHCGG